VRRKMQNGAGFRVRRAARGLRPALGEPTGASWGAGPTGRNDLPPFRREDALTASPASAILGYASRAEVVELADALRSGRSGPCARAGSSPAFGTRGTRGRFDEPSPRCVWPSPSSSGPPRRPPSAPEGAAPHRGGRSPVTHGSRLWGQRPSWSVPQALTSKTRPIPASTPRPAARPPLAAATAAG